MNLTISTMIIIEKLPPITIPHCDKSSLVTWKIPSSGSTTIVAMRRMKDTKMDQLNVLDLNGPTVKMDW